jgi:uncharacterized membrane protein HdeD (DUF308 family)
MSSARVARQTAKNEVPEPTISPEPVLATNSLCGGQEKRTIREPVVEIENSSSEQEGIMGATSVGTIVNKSVGWSIGLSVLMILAGLLAIALPQAAGIAVNLLVGWLLVFSGGAHLVFAWHTRTTGGFLWELLLGVLYLFVGGCLLFQPVAGLASLTLALAFYLFAEGVLEFILSYRLRPMPGSGWLLFDGIITLILSVMIWRTWPSSTEWVIGTLVGISMIFSGISRLMLSLAARRQVAKLA